MMLDIACGIVIGGIVLFVLFLLFLFLVAVLGP